MIPLQDVIYDIRARDGTWCAKKSDRYLKGCPNFPACPPKYTDFKTLQGYDWYAVIEEFDIAAWEHQQAEKHKEDKWTLKQLRNPRHWQKGVEKRLREKAYAQSNRILGDIVLEKPEASGVDLVRTMAKVGVRFEWGEQAKMFRKVMLIGKIHRNEGA